MYSVKITPRTKLQLPAVSLTVGELRLLEPICVYGMPETLSAELRDVLSTLINLTVNPLRPLAEATP